MANVVSSSIGISGALGAWIPSVLLYKMNSAFEEIFKKSVSFTNVEITVLSALSAVISSYATTKIFIEPFLSSQFLAMPIASVIYCIAVGILIKKCIDAQILDVPYLWRVHNDPEFVPFIWPEIVEDLSDFSSQCLMIYSHQEEGFHIPYALNLACLASRQNALIPFNYKYNKFYFLDVGLVSQDKENVLRELQKLKRDVRSILILGKTSHLIDNPWLESYLQNSMETRGLRVVAFVSQNANVREGEMFSPYFLNFFKAWRLQDD